MMGYFSFIQTLCPLCGIVPLKATLRVNGLVTVPGTLATTLVVTLRGTPL